MPTYQPAFLALVTFALTANASLAQSTIEWAAPIDGDFDLAANWLPAVVPGQFDTALLGGVGPYTVLATAGIVGTVNLSNPDVVMQVLRPIGVSDPLILNQLFGSGEVWLGSGVAGESAVLQITDGTMDAHIRLRGPGSFTRLETLGGPCILGPSAVVSGVGLVTGLWSGPGIFRINEPGVLDLDGEYRGVTLQSTRGGTLNFDRAVLLDATIESTPESRYVCGPTAIVQQSVFTGLFRVQPTNTLNLGGGNVVQDGLYIEGRVQAWDQQELDATVLLDGGGLGGPVGGGSAVLGPRAIVTGTGGMSGTWTSSGLVAIDEPGTLSFNGSCTGGSFRASSGGTLDIERATITDATLEVGDDGRFVSDATATLADTIIRGVYRLESGDSLLFGDDVIIEDRIVVGDGVSPSTAEISLELNATLRGRVVLNGLVPSRAVLRSIIGINEAGEDSRIEGTGQMDGRWTVRGVLAPGIGEGGIGLIRPGLRSSLSLTPASMLMIDIAGTDESGFDRIDTPGVSTVIRLDGALDVRFVDGFVPAAGDRFELVDAETVEGSFASIRVEPAGPIAAIGPAHIVNTGGGAVLVLCAADRDGDGGLTIFDFLEYQNQFDAGDPQADLDGDGVLTLFDFLAFQNRFDAGCG